MRRTGSQKPQILVDRAQSARQNSDALSMHPRIPNSKRILGVPQRTQFVHGGFRNAQKNVANAAGLRWKRLVSNAGQFPDQVFRLISYGSKGREANQVAEVVCVSIMWRPRFGRHSCAPLGRVER